MEAFEIGWGYLKKQGAVIDNKSIEKKESRMMSE